MFRDAIERIPFPICGVALGTIALGNLLNGFIPGIRYVGAALAALMLALLVAKCVMVSDFFHENMENPISASVSGTFPMTIMQLMAVVVPWWGPVATVIWGAAVGAHMALIAFFTWRFVVHFQLDQVFATWFIAYVGLAVASVTAPAFGFIAFGEGVFWFALIALLVLVVLVTVSYLARRGRPEATLPLICIYAAPFNLCIVGAINSAPSASLPLLVALWGVACLMYVIAAVNAVLCLRRQFYPSFAAFTFPFVIAAMASQLLAGELALSGNAFAPMEVIAVIQTIIATALVVYVISRYVVFVATPTVVHAVEEEAWDEVSLTDVPEEENLIGYPRDVAEEAERELHEDDMAV